MASRPSVSVVVNTYNRGNSLKKTLEGLRWIRYPEFEVIVVNGPSGDNTEEVLADYAELIRVGRCAEPNLSLSRNIGISMAAGQLVAFIDDDAIPEPDWLDALSQRFADPKVGAVGGFMRDHTGYSFQCRVTACDRFADSKGYPSLEQALIDGASETGRGARSYLSPTGCNSAFRRIALEEIGGFDEEFAYFLDETDVAVRLIDNGWRVTYAEDAEVHHKFAESHLRTNDQIPRSMYLPVRSKAYFVIRHGYIHGLEKAFLYLEEYQRNCERWRKDDLECGRIDNGLYCRLIKEIENGVTDGIRDAFQYPAGRYSQLHRYDGPLTKYQTVSPARERLRICFLSQEYPPGAVGGIAVWTRALAVSLADRGHEISVITRIEGHPRVDFEDGVWVHRIPQLHHPNRSAAGIPNLPPLISDWCFSAFDEMMRIRARRGLDLVSAPIWDVEGAICLAMQDIPVVTSLHSTYKLVLPSKRHWQEDLSYRRGHVDKVIAAERWLLEKSPLILANSKAIVRDIELAYEMELQEGRTRVVPHGMTLEMPKSRLPKGSECVILFVGRFETRKGIDILAEAIPKVLDARGDVRFVLVGNPDIVESDHAPSNRTRVEMLIAKYGERVQMRGMLARDELIAEYARADIFVAPSRYESFGLIFLEAMMHGVACVGTRVGGIPEVLEHGKTGWLVPSEDTSALSDALIALIDDGALREKLGSAARSAFETCFTADRMAEIAEREYRDVILHHRAVTCC